MAEKGFDADVLSAIACLMPTASVTAIRYHIESCGHERPKADKVLDAIDRLIAKNVVRPDVTIEEDHRFPRRVIYYRT